MEYFSRAITAGQNGGRRLQSNNTENGVESESNAAIDRKTRTPAFPHLQQLWLGNTKITGTLPSEIALLTSLQSVS